MTSGAHLADATRYWNYVLTSSSCFSTCKVLGDRGCTFYLFVSWLCLARGLGRADAQQTAEWMSEQTHTRLDSIKCDARGSQGRYSHTFRHTGDAESHIARSPRPYGWRMAFIFKRFGRYMEQNKSFLKREGEGRWCKKLQRWKMI